MKTQMNSKMLGLAFCGMIAVGGCGSDPAAAPTLSIDVFGFGPDFEGGESFVSGLPNYDDAQTVILTSTQPLDKRVLKSDDFVAGTGKGTLAGVTFGENLRIDMDVLDSSGEVLASGATPIFNYDVSDDNLVFRLQVAAVDSVTPIGAVYGTSDGGRDFLPSRFDPRGQVEGQYLGRIGHGVSRTRDGKLVIIGGGDPVPGSATTVLPDFRTINNDIQLYDPETGYFSNIAFDDASGSLIEGDQLFEAVVFPAVTAIGDNRFLVAGGFTIRASEVRPVNTIQIVDLDAPQGQRVQRLVGANQDNAVLRKARGWASASYRPADNTVVVAGGIGPLGDDDILDTFEVIDLETGTVSTTPATMRSARVEHTAITSQDGASVWLVGGRTVDGALKSTEVITGEATADAESLKQARFGHAALNIKAGGGDLVMVVGGFTDFSDATTDTYEVGSIGRGFQSGADWRLKAARGRPTVVELPNSSDVVVLGGRDASGDVATIERMEFVSLDATPYSIRSAGTFDSQRYMATATIVSTGKIVLIGGVGDIGEGTIAAHDSGAMYNAHDPVGDGLVVLLQ